MYKLLHVSLWQSFYHEVCQCAHTQQTALPGPLCYISSGSCATKEHLPCVHTPLWTYLWNNAPLIILIFFFWKHNAPIIISNNSANENTENWTLSLWNYDAQHCSNELDILENKLLMCVINVSIIIKRGSFSENIDLHIVRAERWSLLFRDKLNLPCYSDNTSHYTDLDCNSKNLRIAQSSIQSNNRNSHTRKIKQGWESEKLLYIDI